MPDSPMGEAWFMAPERRLFNELMNDGADQWELEVVESVVETLASGPGCFGRREEWITWLHFLIPRLLTRIDDWRWAQVYEGLVSAFMAQYADDHSEYPYPGFLADTLTTLGRVPMSLANWVNGGIAADKVISSIETTPHGPFVSCGGALSAALFLNLKYLHKNLIPTWMASVFAIENSVWRIKIILWIAKSRELLLKSGRQPDALEFETNLGSGWDCCWCLRGSNPAPQVDPKQIGTPFLCDIRRNLFHDEVRRQLSCSWLEALHAELAEIECSYPDLYVIRDQLKRAAGEIVQDYQLP